MDLFLLRTRIASACQYWIIYFFSVRMSVGDALPSVPAVAIESDRSVSDTVFLFSSQNETFPIGFTALPLCYFCNCRWFFVYLIVYAYFPMTKIEVFPQQVHSTWNVGNTAARTQPHGQEGCSCSAIEVLFRKLPSLSETRTPALLV